MKYLIISLFIAILFFPACEKAPQHLKGKDYMHWVSQKEHGLLMEKKLGEFTIHAQYRSPECMALIRAGMDAGQKKWEKALKEEGNMQYYSVSYSLNNSSMDILKYKMQDESDYFARSNYLAFGVNKDVYVLCGNDSLPCRIHQFTPHYGLSPNADIIFAFDEPDSLHTKNRTLVIEDQLFGLGILRFEFSAEDIHKTPTIIF